VPSPEVLENLAELAAGLKLNILLMARGDILFTLSNSDCSFNKKPQLLNWGFLLSKK
jgi:hypothetical protein